MRFFLEKNGCEVLSVECTDRYVTKPIDFVELLSAMNNVMDEELHVAIADEVVEHEIKQESEDPAVPLDQEVEDFLEELKRAADAGDDSAH